VITSNIGDQAPATRPGRRRMNLEKVVFGFFVLLAATLNFGFFIGDIANPNVHNIYECLRRWLSV
jgi:hypothetical protein